MSKILRFISFLSFLIITVAIIIPIIIYAPSGILLDIEPKSHNFSLPESFSGSLAVNQILSKAEKLFENKIEGPESIAVLNGTIYTSSSDGYIYQIDEQNHKIRPIIKIINKTCSEWNQTICSRPLGMKFNSQGVLYLVEGFYGIFAINDIMTPKPKVRHILSYEKTNVLGKASKLFDDIAIDENNGLNGGDVLYITDISTKFDLSEFAIALGSSELGRIIRYDINANKLDIVLDQILCPNGIEISDDSNYLIFSETMARRIVKHNIRDNKTQILVSGLPGEPDNLRKTDNNTYWVALVNGRTQQNRLLMDWTEDKPEVRKLLFRSLDLIGKTIQSFGQLLGSETLKNFGFNVKTGLSYLFVGKLLRKSHGLAIEFNIMGDIIRSIHSPDGTVTLLSEVKQVKSDNKTVLFLGSYYNKYLGKLIL